MFSFFKKPLTNYEATLALLRIGSDLNEADQLRYEYILRGIDKYCHDNGKKLSPRLRIDIQLAAAALTNEEGVYYIDLFKRTKSLDGIDFCVGKVREIFENHGLLWQYPVPIERKISEALSSQSEKSFEASIQRTKTKSDERSNWKNSSRDNGLEKTPATEVSGGVLTDHDGFSVTPVTKLDDHPSQYCKGINKYLSLYLDEATVYSKASPSRALYDFRAWLERQHPDVYEEYSLCFQEHKLSQMREVVASHLDSFD